MLPLPDPRLLATFTRPALLAFIAAAAALICAQAIGDSEPVIASVFGGVFLSATFLGWTGSLARRDSIRNIATSTATGAALGYIELAGVARSGAQPGLRSQIAKRACVWYRYRIERRVGAGWLTEASAASEDCFLLRDATGECVIDPEGAEIVPRRQRCWREFAARYHEQWIAPDDTLYVLGELTSISAALDSPAELKQDLSALLAEWKRDPVDLLRRFDADHSGALDESEWEQARRAARTEVERDWGARHSLGPLNIVRKPRDGRRYLISAYAPAQLAARFSRWAWLHLALFFGGMILVLVVTTSP